MPISPAHDIKSSEDEFHRHSLVEEIAHGVYEDGLGLLPLERRSRAFSWRVRSKPFA